MVIGLIFLLAIIVDWTDNNVANETGFYVERTISGNCVDGFIRIATTPANTHKIEDAVGSPGDCYRVAAFNDGGIIVYSNASQIPRPADTQPPSVSITAPVNDTVVPRRTNVTIRANFSDNVGVVAVRYFVNGTALQCAAMATSCIWRVPNAPSKDYAIRVEASDQAGGTGISQATVRSSR